MIHHLTGIPKLSLVAICHDAPEWRNRLDEAHRHRFEGEHTIRLERYTVDELADILESRADQGFEPGAIERDQIVSNTSFRLPLVNRAALPRCFEPAIERCLDAFVGCSMLRVDLPAFIICVETSERRFMHDVDLATYCPLRFARFDAFKRLNDCLERGDLNVELAVDDREP